MKLTPRQYGQLLYEITHEVAKNQLAQRLEKFIALLVNRRALVLVPRILRAFEQIWNQQENVVPVKVITPRKMSSTIKSALLKTLTKKRMELVEEINPALIGGITLQIDDTIIDGSVKSYLSNLQKRLTQ